MYLAITPNGFEVSSVGPDCREKRVAVGEMGGIGDGLIHLAESGGRGRILPLTLDILLK